MVNHVADSRRPKTCTMTRVHDEILIECVEMGADGVLCDLCRGRYDGVLEMLRTGTEHPDRVRRIEFDPPVCPYCDLFIEDLDCTCFDHAR